MMTLTPKVIARAILGLLPHRISDPIWALKNRVQWRYCYNTQHVKYWQEYEARKPFILALVQLLDGLELHVQRKVIEFGCSGGCNLRLLRELSSRSVEYCGLDINAQAVAYARKKFPDACFHVCSDVQLPGLVAQLGHFHVFLVSGVLTYLPSDRAQRVLEHAVALADYVIVCDNLSCFSSRQTTRDGSTFVHPFGFMCREAGLQVIVQPTPVGGRYSFFVARSVQAGS